MLDAEKLATYVYFVNEREQMRIKKQSGMPAPWTDDEILNTYRFCNIRRRDDRVSAWLINNLYAPNIDHPLLWFMPVICRWINWPPTIKEMIEQDAWEQTELHDDWFVALGDQIDYRVSIGEKTWTGAYLITARTIKDGLGKGRWIAESTWKPLWESREKFEEFFACPPQARTVKDALGLFKGAFNHGTFMAGQIVADWTYTHLLDQAADLYSYAPVGPGSTRGMNHLRNRPFEKSLAQDKFVDELVELIEETKSSLHGSDEFTAHDWQNSLCEYSKWVRVKQGGSAPRAKYTPERRY